MLLLDRADDEAAADVRHPVSELDAVGGRVGMAHEWVLVGRENAGGLRGRDGKRMRAQLRHRAIDCERNTRAHRRVRDLVLDEVSF